MELFISTIKEFLLKTLFNYGLTATFNKFKQPIEFVISMPIILLMFIISCPLSCLDMIRGIDRDYRYMFVANMTEIQKQMIIWLNRERM